MVDNGIGYSIYTEAEVTDWDGQAATFAEIVGTFRLDSSFVQAAPASSPTATPTPAAATASATYIYTDADYWCRVELPVDWYADVSTPGRLTLRHGNTDAGAWIALKEIDASVYPTLTSYVQNWQLIGNEDWVDFENVREARIRHGLPIQAQEYEYRVEIEETARRDFLCWYVVGRYQIAVEIRAPVWVWGFPDWSPVRRALETILYSFEPSSFVSTDFGVSMAHAPSWKAFDDEDSFYWARDALSGAFVSAHARSGWRHQQRNGLWRAGPIHRHAGAIAKRSI